MTYDVALRQRVLAISLALVALGKTVDVQPPDEKPHEDFVEVDDVIVGITAGSRLSDVLTLDEDDCRTVDCGALLRSGQVIRSEEGTVRVLSPSSGLLFGQRVDMNSATARQLEVLPTVGPIKAAAIVQARAYGPFRDLNDLASRVRGIGPKSVVQLVGYVRFEGVQTVQGGAPSDTFGTTMNVNCVSSKALASLPGIGPKKAADIVDYRRLHWGFGTVEELERVSGIGPFTLSLLRPLVEVRPC